MSAVTIMRIQAAAIYLQAGVAKMFKSDEWANGTALYYWLLDPRLGLPTAYRDIVLSMFAPDFMVALLTWTPVVLEITLAFVLTMPAKHFLRGPLFWIGFVFHLGNIVFFGLVSFFASMLAVLILLTRPIGDQYRVPRWLKGGPRPQADDATCKT